MQAKKIPLRKCLGCNEQKPKRELVRIVRTPDGSIVLDSTGKQAGRGAYICPDPACLRKAQKGKRIEKSLETPVSEELFESLALTLENNE
ncbi:MAG: YlxR family protein [Clostridia bacterium]|nr:YlxR family protein [Clostridia bacterium]